MTAPVNKIIPFSSVDGPGNRTALFLQGCNYNCQYCHNPETINACINCGACIGHCPTGALVQQGDKINYDHQKCILCDACFAHCPHSASPRVRRMSAKQAMAEIKKNLPFVRGVTVSGGECTLWPGFLRQLLALAKAEGLNTLLDSNGSYDFSADAELLAVTDGVMLDVKAWDCAEHTAITGCGNAMVRKNLTFLARQAKLEEVRTVVIPGLFDAEQTVKNASEALAPYTALRPIRYKLICYRPVGVRSEYHHLKPPTGEYLRQLEQIAHAAGLSDTVII